MMDHNDIPPPSGQHDNSKSYLEHLQLFHTPLYQFLYPALIALVLVFSESVSRSSLGVFSEIVSGELAGLAEEGAIL